MDQARISFFPDGLPVMIIDDDAKAVRRATATLSQLQYAVVATHSTASAGLRALSGDNVVDIQAILCDVHKVVSSGFDFRRVVESELRIPVIYLLSKMEEEDMVAGEDAEFLNHLLLTATYIVRKPLNPTVMARLWRVVAWRRYCLEERIQANVAANAGAGGEDDDDDDVVIVEEPQVHFKAVRRTSGGSRKRQLAINVVDDGNRGSGSGGGGGGSGAGANPTRILQHITSNLQEFRAKHQKKDMANERPLISSDSTFLKAILPTLNISPRNPLTLTGGVGSRSVGAEAFAGGSSSAAPPQIPVFQQLSTGNGKTVISFSNNASPTAMRATTDNTMISFNNVSTAPVANAVISFSNISRSATMQAPAARGQHLSGDVQQLDFPQQKLYFGPFSYQGPPPPSMHNHINLLPPTSFPPTCSTDNGKAPIIELPYEMPVDDFLVGQTAYGGAGPSIGATDATAAAYPYTDALSNNVATGCLMAPPTGQAFSITEPTVVAQGEGTGTGVDAGTSEKNAVVEAPNNAAPLMVLDQVAADAAMDAEQDIMFSLESLLGPDYDLLPMEDVSAPDTAAAGDAAGGSLDGEEGGMDIGWDLDLDDILVENDEMISFFPDGLHVMIIDDDAKADLLSFFPGGLRVMLVDGDTKNTRTATKTLSTLHYPVVATHTTASAGLRTLSGDNMTDVQTVLCDIKKVVSSGFDFRRVVETEHHIPVIYLLSTTEPEQMVAREDTEFLNHLLLKATYIVRKPLDRAAMAQLWRAVRSRGSRKRQLTINVDSGSSDGADANPRQKLEHMNDAKGPLGQHVASHLQPQEYCTKQQKDLDERRLLSSDSLFLKAILPTLNVSPCNPLILTVGAGPSCIPTTTIAGGSTAAPFPVSVFQQQQQQPAGTAVISFSNTTVQAPTGNAVISFSNAASPAATGNAVISFNNVAAPAAVQAPVMGQRLSGGVQPDAPQQRLYMGPFSYQGPPPPPTMRNHVNIVPAAFTPQVGMTMNKDKAPMIELSFGLPVDDFLVGQTAYGGAGPSIGAPDDDAAAAAYAYTSALNNNAAAGSLMVPPIESTFTIIDPIVGTKGEGSVPVVVASEDQNNAVAAVEATAPNNAELCMMPEQVDVEEGIMFSLESLLGLDEDMIPMEDAGGEATDGSLNIKEGGMEIGWDLDLDDILMNNTNEFAFLDDLAWIE
uniref:Response regulatory domain-containing protein n=1 Tax=Oryza meridionalis TaxID=40149 RepID=A0A0E0F787_9ORYZ